MNQEFPTSPLLPKPGSRQEGSNMGERSRPYKCKRDECLHWNPVHNACCDWEDQRPPWEIPSVVILVPETWCETVMFFSMVVSRRWSLLTTSCRSFLLPARCPMTHSIIMLLPLLHCLWKRKLPKQSNFHHWLPPLEPPQQWRNLVYRNFLPRPYNSIFQCDMPRHFSAG